MEIVYDEAALSRYMARALEVSPGKPILIDKFLEAAIEVDVDCLSDGTRTLIGGVMQHIEEAGIHSGDSACVIPPHSLPSAVVKEIKRQTRELARELNVKGLMNVQFAIAGGKEHESGVRGQGPEVSEEGPSFPISQEPIIYVLEVNPRASRTVPFVSKATGVPLARYAALVMVGKTLDELGLMHEVEPAHYSVKESVFPFNKFPGVDIILGPEMRSTGEVMGIDDRFPLAFAKSQLAANSALPEPEDGKVFFSVAERDKEEVVAIAAALAHMGYQLIATRGTARTLRAAGVAVEEVPKLQEGRPNLIDLMKDKKITLVINTPSGKGARTDEGKIRAAAVANGVTCITTLAAAHAAVEACRAIRDHQRQWTVRSLQERFPSGS
jgi:carbamoyl-phosphate synthase large subunit